MANSKARYSRLKFPQERWFDMVSELPPQLSRRHISAISICSIIGTGVFLTTLSKTLREAGPGGALIAYILVSSIVYCTVISNAEMMAHLPNVGGPVGLADVFVDPALGFAMGWNAWYHWSIIIPTQLGSAGTLAIGYLQLYHVHINPMQSMSINYVFITVFLIAAIGLNFLSAKNFGRIHVGFALLKMATLVTLIIISVAIAARSLPTCSVVPFAPGCNTPGRTPPTLPSCAVPRNELPAKLTIGGRYWTCPGAFVQPFGTKGTIGSIMGVFTVMIYAAFAFFGTEVAGVPGREIKDSTNSIPRSIKGTWLRVTLLYVGAVLAAGLVVPSIDPGLTSTSPWILAMNSAGYTFGPKVLMIVFILSAFSAASADIYVSSRYMFFLARRGHAPWVLGSLYKSAAKTTPTAFESSEDRDRTRVHTPSYDKSMPSSPPAVSAPLLGLTLHHDQDASAPRATGLQLHIAQPSTPPRPGSRMQTASPGFEAPRLRRARTVAAPPPPDVVVPWVGVIFAGGVGLLVFLKPSAVAGRKANDTFTFFTTMTNCACLVSWVGILVTYLRFYQGTQYAEGQDPNFKKTNKESLYKHRAWGQPWLARYALVWCIIILLGQGWPVFTVPGVRRIAEMEGDPPEMPNPDIGSDFSLAFITAYLPIPMFLLLAFGYKLVYQTRFVPVEEMKFNRGRVPKAPPAPASNLLARLCDVLL